MSVILFSPFREVLGDRMSSWWGGELAGLSAGWRLRHWDLSVVESGDRVGGVSALSGADPTG
jgi:hypothetical protein